MQARRKKDLSSGGKKYKMQIISQSDAVVDFHRVERTFNNIKTFFALVVQQIAEERKTAKAFERELSRAKFS
jgi:predicted deacylase